MSIYHLWIFLNLFHLFFVSLLLFFLPSFSLSIFYFSIFSSLFSFVYPPLLPFPFKWCTISSLLHERRCLYHYKRSSFLSIELRFHLVSFSFCLNILLLPFTFLVCGSHGEDQLMDWCSTALDSVCKSEKLFISPAFSKDIFTTGYRNLGWQFCFACLFFSTLRCYFPSSHLPHFWQEFCCAP